jgi:hypothetical protein
MGNAQRGRVHVRIALVRLVTITAALAADVQSGSAQESFFNDRYCTRGGGKSGQLNCAFNTWQQCIETARGSADRYCTVNPFWHGPRQNPTTQRITGRRYR